MKNNEFNQEQKAIIKVLVLDEIERMKSMTRRHPILFEALRNIVDQMEDILLKFKEEK